MKSPIMMLSVVEDTHNLTIPDILIDSEEIPKNDDREKDTAGHEDSKALLGETYTLGKDVNNDLFHRDVGENKSKQREMTEQEMNRDQRETDLRRDAKKREKERSDAMKRETERSDAKDKTVNRNVKEKNPKSWRC